MGPGALWHQRGPWVLRLCEENVWHTSVQPQGRYGTWPLRLDPAVMLKLSAAQRGVSSCSHLTLRRDLAQQGRVSDPVASCSSPRGGPTDFCPHFCLPPGDRPDGNSCEAGSQCFATPTGAAPANAAPDNYDCQVCCV